MSGETRVTFYSGVPHRGRFLHRLLETRVLASGMTALVFAGSEAEAAELDSYLWTCREESFLPHARAGDGWAESSPILIAGEISAETGLDSLRADVLVDWSMRAPEFPEVVRAFPRMVDIVAADEESASAGRIRFRKLREMGFNVEAHAVARR